MYGLIFFALPIYYLVIIYVTAALLPAFFLMRYIYVHDTIEKEPPLLLLSLVVRGVLAALAAAVLEMIGKALLGSFVPADSPNYIFYFAFLVVAATEEGMKYLFLYRKTWRNPNFNCRFDGIVYAAFVSLGFAGFENILYIFQYGLSVALPRAILAIPGHLGFSVFMGFFYSRAKRRYDMGKITTARIHLLLAYLAPVFLHGVYDSCCMLGSNMSTVVFLLFVAAMYFIVIRLIKRESRTDRPI
ncbi:MAG: PrsW family glutamic-type intramembrane protease [Oscillospiraceae bacterium]|nr:PrsW family glutamic-type intramembrane protease [Clostridiales bacterium]MDD7674802.1 PrsW family glutamic-type intramembrane protease [Oscillospiraceae bacterium]